MKRVGLLLLGLCLIAVATGPSPRTASAAGVAVISAGAGHTCAVTAGGGVRCWGRNDSGQVGDGTVVHRRTPASVLTLDSGVTALAAGGLHTCALTKAGGVKCWGYNGGEIGDGTTTERHAPVAVSGLSSGVVAITAGGAHTCALASTGGVKCWGANGFGQLGAPTSTTCGQPFAFPCSTIPLDVSGLTSGVAAIAAGELHTCAVMKTGAVKCWGSNGNGQVGDGTTSDRPTPVDVAGLSSVVAITAGGAHTCAVTSAGGAKCWGDNSSGQLGAPTSGACGQPFAIPCSTTPLDVSGLTSGVAAITAGELHTCAVMETGAVKCWGSNGFGQLGDGTTTDRALPTSVSGLGTGVGGLAAGDNHTCAIAPAGVLCWGFNYFGGLGNGTTASSGAPVGVVGLSLGIIASGISMYTCALTAGGGLKCWGDNEFGQLGDGTTTPRTAPADVAGLGSGVAAVATGHSHTCVVTTAGGVKCWGEGMGRIGDDTAEDRLTPTDVCVTGATGPCTAANNNLLAGVVALAAGSSHTCALTAAGGVKCWGVNMVGQFGNGTADSSPTPVDVCATGATPPCSAANGNILTDVAAITAGANHTCALITAGRVKCWGHNVAGQVGDGTSCGSGCTTPVDVCATGATPPCSAANGNILTDVTAITAGSNHTCALTTAGGVKCWGSRTWGQLGDGTGQDYIQARTTPVDAVGLASGVAAITAGGLHTCALTTAGGVKCWGRNVEGQLGATSSDFCSSPPVHGFECSSTPLDVVGLASGVAAVSAGTFHTCAVTTAGSAKCWGANEFGKLGDAGWTPHTTPVDVCASGSGASCVPLSGIGTITAGWQHTCALTKQPTPTTHNAAKCWGRNNVGQTAVEVIADRGGTVWDVPDLTGNLNGLDAGAFHTCAVTTTREVWCWGQNTFHQLGGYDFFRCGIQDPDLYCFRPVGPVSVAAAVAAGGPVIGAAAAAAGGPVIGAIAVAAGGRHTCALTAAGGVKCWGWNLEGQLGAMSPEGDRQCPMSGGVCSQSPLDVTGLTGGVTRVAAGWADTCALTTGGTVKCWGQGVFGQLGDGTTTGRMPPADVCATGATPPCTTANGNTLTGGRTITAGDFHNCVLTTAGGVKCWGLNYAGQLGEGTTVTRTTPVDVVGLASVVVVAAGGEHTCALTTAGVVKCWGQNSYHQLGAETAATCSEGYPYPCSTTPADVMGLASVVVVAAGGEHTCALTTAGVVKCWGNNAYGQLADGSNAAPRMTPGDVVGLPQPKDWDGGGCTSVQAAGDRWRLGAPDGPAGNCSTPVGPNITVALDNGVTLTFEQVTQEGATTAASSGTGPPPPAGFQLGSPPVYYEIATTAEFTGQVKVCIDYSDIGFTPDVEAGLRLFHGVSGEWIDVTNDKSPDPNPDTIAKRICGVVNSFSTFIMSELIPGEDYDADGCMNAQEMGPNPALGGQRAPLIFWDFFDTPDANNLRDHIISAGDIQRIVLRFGTNGSPAITPLSQPPVFGYHTAFDRSPPAPGGQPWDLSVPDGSIAANDILFVVRQFGHTCA